MNRLGGRKVPAGGAGRLRAREVCRLSDPGHHCGRPSAERRSRAAKPVRSRPGDQHSSVNRQSCFISDRYLEPLIVAEPLTWAASLETVSATRPQSVSGAPVSRGRSLPKSGAREPVPERWDGLGAIGGEPDLLCRDADRADGADLAGPPAQRRTRTPAGGMSRPRTVIRRRSRRNLVDGRIG